MVSKSPLQGVHADSQLVIALLRLLTRYGVSNSANLQSHSHIEASEHMFECVVAAQHLPSLAVADWPAINKTDL